MIRLTELVGDNWIARQEKINGKYPTDREVYSKLAKYEDLEEQGLLFITEGWQLVEMTPKQYLSQITEIETRINLKLECLAEMKAKIINVIRGCIVASHLENQDKREMLDFMTALEEYLEDEED